MVMQAQRRRHSPLTRALGGGGLLLIASSI
jgi:hypothetical protein